VDVSLIDRGDIWEARASGLSITLTGGEEYWAGLTPIGEYGKVGNEFHLQAQDMVGDQAAWRDRGWSGILGWWFIDAFTLEPADTAFKIEGTIIPEPSGLLLLSAVAALCGQRTMRRFGKGALQ
jgi:hypothetical protein